MKKKCFFGGKRVAPKEKLHPKIPPQAEALDKMYYPSIR